MPDRAKRGSIAAAVLLAGCVLLTAAPAPAHFDGRGRYTHTGCPGTTSNRVDPVNVVFYAAATAAWVKSQVEQYTGWTNTTGSAQTFVEHGSCYPMSGQLASGTFTRYHVRFRSQHSDPVLGHTTLASAHHEDWVLTCNFGAGGHAVDSNSADPSGSGFDQGRNALAVGLAAGHDYHYVWWGNTQSFKQCDGDYAASDGATVFLELQEADH